MRIKNGRGYFFGPADLSMSSSGSLLRVGSSFPDGSVVSSALRWFPSTMVKDVNRNCYIQDWVGGKATYLSFAFQREELIKS